MYVNYKNIVLAGPSSSDIYFPDCVCKEDHSGFECSESGYTDPPNYRVVTRDIMIDLSKQREARRGDYYLYTTDEYRLHRYINAIYNATILRVS